MEQPHVIGHVVSVNGFRVKVELSPDAKSSARATPDGVQRAVSINSVLTFDLGAGAHALGLLSNLDARETFDPGRDDELSLELTKPRRIASVQLIGTVRRCCSGVWAFDTGITILPTLDTPAEVASPQVLAGVFATPPKRNRPRGHDGENYDYPLEIGHQTGDENTKVKASFNDLFSRPLAVVGNTGSGKSYTVASLARSVLELPEFSAQKTVEPHIFILDINGEYANAFFDGEQATYQREPNRVYLNGSEFCIPAWLMNGEEICDWLQASEATQEPILKDWWSIAKSTAVGNGDYDKLQVAISKIDAAVEWLDRTGNKNNEPFKNNLQLISDYATEIDVSDLLVLPNWSANNEWASLVNEKEFRDRIYEVRKEALEKISARQNQGTNFVRTADSPRFVAVSQFRDPNLIDRSTDHEGSKKIDQYLMTLKLRLRTRLDDKRWKSFFTYEEQGISSFENWTRNLGIASGGNSRVSILDFSMLASEVLPFACAVVGRLLLETREMLKPDVRSKYPWVLVLEEAHNYARPKGRTDDRGQSLSRRAFERVAKEGRKFGISLIVASQRPSEISSTIISQCANFFSHRLQNPDDIDHFRRIIPRQAQRLLDQVTVLAAGEAIVFGSAVHVSGRVQIKLPSQEPWSATAAPFLDWKQEDAFPLAQVIEQWGLGEDDQPLQPDDNQPATPIEEANQGEAVVVEADDDIDDKNPF